MGHVVKLLSAALFAAAVGACLANSPPSRFYTLSSLKKMDDQAPAASSNQKTGIVAVGPVSVAEYLDRPEIVTRSGEYDITLNEFHRWSCSLESCISRAVMENLSVLLPPREFSVVQWSPLQTDMRIRFRVTVDVVRFDVSPGGAALLEADWVIYKKNKQIALMRKSTANAKVVGTGFPDMAAAMSKAVEDLSCEIAAAVIELQQKSARNGGKIKP